MLAVLALIEIAQTAAQDYQLSRVNIFDSLRYKFYIAVFLHLLQILMSAYC